MSEVKNIKNGVKGFISVIREYTDEPCVDVSKLPEDAQERIHTAFDNFMADIRKITHPSGKS